MSCRLLDAATTMQADKNFLWEMKLTPDWKILGQRRTIRLRLHKKLYGRESELKEGEQNSCSAQGDEFQSTVSSQDAWRALGRRRLYRTPSNVDSSTQNNRNPMDRVRDFRAAATSAWVHAERYNPEKKSSKGDASLPAERPHISTLYFLAEMEQFK
jgi:hypothetical protein